MKDSTRESEVPERVYYELWKESIKSLGRTLDNPSVACVITRNGEILSGGATEPPGLRHAEIVALEKLSSLPEELLNNLIMYVTLEPCSTYGRTPPCVLAIKNFKDIIKKIYIENLDPHLGKTGMDTLIRLGFDVEMVEIFYKPHFALHSFLQSVEKKRPQYILKVATDKNYFLGTEYPVDITGSVGKTLTMLFRAKVDAVLTGPNTTITDMPSLNLREEEIRTYEIREDRDFLFWQTDFLRKNRVPYDEFLRGTVIFAEEITGEFRFFSYQPFRVFLAGRNFRNIGEFVKKQEKITEITQKEYFILVPFSVKEELAGKNIPEERFIVVPDLRDSSFFPRLHEFFHSLGVQKVLVESGAGLFQLFFPELNIYDKIYWIENQNEIHIPEGESFQKKYWFYSRYPLLLRDKIFIGSLRIYSLSKSNKLDKRD